MLYSSPIANKPPRTLLRKQLKFTTKNTNKMGLFKINRIQISSEISIEIEVDIDEKTASIEVSDPQGTGFYIHEEDIDNLIKSLQEAKKLIK